VLFIIDGDVWLLCLLVVIDGDVWLLDVEKESNIRVVINMTHMLGYVLVIRLQKWFL
jgi:hypothetical protein